MSQIFAVTIGSIAGGLARYFLSGVVLHHGAGKFPYGTLTVNLTGCFIVGVIAEIAGVRVPTDAVMRLLLITGFCGALTTFSAFVVETHFLFRNGQPGLGVLNLVLNLVAGFALFRLGEFLVRFVWPL